MSKILMPDPAINWLALHKPITLKKIKGDFTYEKLYIGLKDGMNWPALELYDQDGSLKFTVLDVLERGRGLGDAILALRFLPSESKTAIRIFTAKLAAHVVHLVGDDSRPRAAIQATVDYAFGKISRADLAASHKAAWGAYYNSLENNSLENTIWRYARASAIWASCGSTEPRETYLCAKKAVNKSPRGFKNAVKADLRDLLLSPPKDAKAWVWDASASFRAKPPEFDPFMSILPRLREEKTSNEY